MFARPTLCAAFRPAHIQKSNSLQLWTQIPRRCWKITQSPHARRFRSTFREQVREQYRRSPIAFPFALFSVVAVGAWMAYYVPMYYHHIIIKPYHNFPESVAKKLRRALFYSRGSYLDIREANKYFRQALQLATEEGMDPFSDEVLGIKYAISALFEEQGYYAMACDVLEIMRSDCQRWVDEFSDQHWTDGSRSRVKKHMVRINVKLAELYNLKYVNEPDNAEKRLVEAVESTLQEKQRRDKEGMKQGEGDWMTDSEIGATLEALGHHYELNNAHQLALPLFLRSLELCPPISCHSAILMNNISTSLVQQNPTAASTTSPQPPPTRAVSIEQAHQWARKALERATSIPYSSRDEECDLGCAVATHNLGEFFEMEGKIVEARQKYDEAGRLAKKIAFVEGKTNAQAGLQRLRGLEKNRQ